MCSRCTLNANLKAFTLNVHPAKVLSCQVMEFLAGPQELAEVCFGLLSELDATISSTSERILRSKLLDC